MLLEVHPPPPEAPYVAPLPRRLPPGPWGVALPGVKCVLGSGRWLFVAWVGVALWSRPSFFSFPPGWIAQALLPRTAILVGLVWWVECRIVWWFLVGISSGTRLLSRATPSVPTIPLVPWGLQHRSRVCRSVPFLVAPLMNIGPRAQGLRLAQNT